MSPLRFCSDGLRLFLDSNPSTVIDPTGFLIVLPPLSLVKLPVSLKFGTVVISTVTITSGTIVAAHIHCAAPGVNGPVGLNLGVEPFTSEKGEVVRSTVTDVSSASCGWNSADDVAAAIEMGAAYVNIHTAANPGGEIRGNLSAR